MTNFPACRDLIYVHSLDSENFRSAWCTKWDRSLCEADAIRIRNLQQQPLGADWREHFKFTLHG
jgi:hypothetical protein